MKKKVTPKIVKMIDEALEAIIDQWYLSVSDYYLTVEKKEENPELSGPEELKRFHDETGHRIKFNKGDLDFTYGLSIDAKSNDCYIEISVNNKVPNFNYGELVRRLSMYYEGARIKPVEGYKKGKEIRYSDVFGLPENLQNSMVLEQREGKADIVRISFEINDSYLQELVSEASNFMELIHQYCVAPLRRIYAEVYRINRKT